MEGKPCHVDSVGEPLSYVVTTGSVDVRYLDHEAGSVWLRLSHVFGEDDQFDASFRADEALDLAARLTQAANMIELRSAK